MARLHQKPKKSHLPELLAIFCVLFLFYEVFVAPDLKPKQAALDQQYVQAIKNQITIDFSNDGSIVTSEKPDVLFVHSKATVTNNSKSSVSGTIKIKTLTSRNDYIGSTKIPFEDIKPNTAIQIPFKVQSTLPGPRVFNHYEYELTLTNIR